MLATLNHFMVYIFMVFNKQVAINTSDNNVEAFLHIFQITMS